MTNKGWFLKTFGELGNTELYDILRLRSAVFVVEQKCIFEDMDNKDRDCHHLYYSAGNEVLACSRLFPPGKFYDEPSIGRVCTSPDQRGNGLGKELMKRSLEYMDDLYPGHPVKIGAQSYLKRFYESFGFEKYGDPYIEDDIEHIYMIRPAH